MPEIISMDAPPMSKKETDLKLSAQFKKQRKTEVKFINRFGRPVYVREYEAKKMVRRGEGTIVPDTARPLQNKPSPRVQPPKETKVILVNQADNKVVPNQTPVEPVVDNTALEGIQTTYEAVVGKVPVNKKNDAKWLSDKIALTLKEQKEAAKSEPEDKTDEEDSDFGDSQGEA